MVCDFNDMLWDLYGMLWDLYAMLWEIEMKGLMIWYGMLCYGMLWDLNKNASIHRRVPHISKWNNKKPKFTTNLSCKHLCFQIKKFKTE